MHPLDANKGSKIGQTEAKNTQDHPTFDVSCRFKSKKMTSTETALAYTEEGNLSSNQSILQVPLLKDNSLNQSAVTSTIFDDKMYEAGDCSKTVEIKTGAIQFPLQLNTCEPRIFPISFVKSEGRPSFSVPSEKSVVTKGSHYRRAPYIQNIEEFNLQHNAKKFYDVENPSSVREVQISNVNSCQHRFPMSQIRNNTKFPSRFNLPHVTSSKYTYKFEGKLYLRPPRVVNSTLFPMTQTFFVGGRPIMSNCDKLLFPMKTGILSRMNQSTDEEDNNTLSLTMTQSNSFMHTNFNEQRLVEIRTEKQTNLENSEYEQKAPEQIIYVHKQNDDVLATEVSKNTQVLGQPKRCGERVHIGEHIQNSRSASETQCSHKNMNDFENYPPQQCNKGQQVNRKNTSLEINKTPSPSPPPKAQSTTAALEKMCAGITVQKKEKNFNDAAKPQINRTNNLSDINFEYGQQPWSTCLIHSEVRDPSSQEELLVGDRVVCEPSTARSNIEPIPPPAAESISTNEAASTSSNYQLTSLSCSIQPSTASQIITATQHVQNDCQNFVAECVAPNAKSDVSAASSDPSPGSAEARTSTELRRVGEPNDYVRGTDIAMTLTKIEEQKEEFNINVSLSHLDDNKNEFFVQESLDEMKFEMNGAKGASNVIPRSLGSNTHVKTERIQSAASGSSVLSAATDVSKLANFGKSRRESSLLPRSESTTSIDPKESVLPARTLLRRQRRMHSQYSEDKQEDSIERLNRLRARISGALNEVKGVLKHYSTDEGGETEQGTEPNDTSSSMDSHKLTTDQATVKEEGPVSFRFVKKIRRRSVFNEEETCEVKKDTKCQTTEANDTTNSENNCRVPKEEIHLEQEEVKVHDDVSCFSGHEDRNKSQECKNFAVNSSSKIIMASNENIREKSEKNIESAEQCSEIKVVPNLKSLEIDNSVIEVAEVETECCITQDISVEIELKSDEPHIAIPLDNETKRPKKRITKSKQNTRRASIAAIEGSQIDPLVNIAIPLAIKTQRRPSDSEAIVKRKIIPSDDNAPTKNIRTIVKEKRPPVKKNAAISKVDVNQHNDRTKNASTTTHLESSVITTVNDATRQATIKTELPITSDSLSTELETANAIDDAELNSGDKLDKMKSEVKQPLSTAKNAWGSPTKLSAENGEMVAAMASQLPTGEPSNHTINAEKQPLNIQIDKSKDITTSAEKTNDQCFGEDHSKDLPVADVSNVKNSKRTEPINVEFLPNNQEYNTDPGQLNYIKCCSKGSNNSEFFISAEEVSSTLHLHTPISPNTNTLCPAQTDTVSIRRNSPEEHIIKSISNQNLELPIAGVKGGSGMPEQQVAHAPVKPVQVFAENDASKISIPKKKTIIKRIIRKNSIDKGTENKKAIKNAEVETEKGEGNDRLQLSSSLTPEKSESHEEESGLDDEIKTVEESADESAVALIQPKKPRKVKKKVIIKRQQRKLSVGETSFFKEPDQPDATLPATETLERTIAYVTDEEDETTTDQTAEPVRPIKSCMKQREFQVGDWVMYGERFRKTQIRWKKGQITERITSISYKIKIDDKEISAHISYIKKYTGRRVNFGGKEYLEIDYEQIAEEERRARTYSIWNMV